MSTEPAQTPAVVEQLRSDRLSLFLAGGAPSLDCGVISIEASSMGTTEDWEWSAVVYCKCALNGTRGGADGGTVEVSAAALGILLGMVERLAIKQGLI